MNTVNENEQDVIVFENLRRPSDDIVGDYTSVKARVIPVAEPFVRSNAAGTTRIVESLTEVGELARQSGLKIKAVFAQ